MSECKRCGRCCIEVGRTFWKNGRYDDIPALEKLASNGDHEDGSLPCEMLEIVKGLAVCKIEREYGRQYKPVTCRDYPEDGELCFREQAMAEMPRIAQVENRVSDVPCET